MVNSNTITLSLSPDLNQIAKLIDRSRPQVVVVVGTGVAINATGLSHASWLGLLKHGIRHLVAINYFTKSHGDRLESSLNAAFSHFNLQTALQHAEAVEQVLNTPDEKVFAQWLETAFASFKARNEEKAKAPLDALRDLHEAGVLLLTTNYDNLLSDITGAPPVTWEEHADFHRVMTRQKAGILHIHGHWQRPSSIVLGRSSYDRVVADVDLQQLFRTLWLNWSWIYVGCGDGLDDPNLGRLLEWSKGWGESGLPDFFLARDDKAKEIAARSNKPPNLRSIGYPSHDELPVMLRSVTPAARCWPFVQVDDQFPLFHVSGASDPFPSRQEYVDGIVPAFAADAELLRRLQAHGWACCIDVASVGKTTLALRVATSREQRLHPFYLDLKREIEDDVEASPVAAVNRLARPGTLLILDNVHYKPELARQLWQQWLAKPSDSRGRLLLVATRIHQPVVVTPEEDLTFFERHPANPAILLQPTPEDLGRLAKHIYHRVGGAKCPPMPEPPTEALAEWHPVYRAALNAFTFVVLDSLADFQNGRWPLPPSRASAWVRKHWLDRLDAPELENAVCLAAFGAQELEMLVQNDALPHPGKTKKLFELGLVAQTLRGQLKQYRQFELREPGWGRLILAALTQSVDEEQILFAAASRHLQTAIVLSARLRRDGNSVRLIRLWEYITPKADGLVKQVWDLPLPYFPNLVRLAKIGGQPELAIRFWKTIEAEPHKLGSSAWANSLDSVGSFLDVAKQHGRDTAVLWDAILGKPGDPDQQAKLDKLGSSAWATSLDSVGSFLNVAKQHGRDTAVLWDAILGKPGDPDQQAKLDKLDSSAWANSLDKVGSFLDVAKQHGRDTAPLWQILANAPDRLSQKGKTATLEALVGFAHYAPISLLEIAVREIRPGHWNSTSFSKALTGATWLAWECANAKRDDLATDLLTLLLRRANWRDFPSQAGGYAQVCWLLANIPECAADFVDTFLKAVRTDKWLQIAYAASSCGQLASGLRQLALHQSLERCRQFHHKGLGGRLNKELERFETAAPAEQSQIIQFLGCAGLCGWAVSQRGLSGITHESVSQLPVNILPHRARAAQVEDYQVQLWLGLRTFVSITRASLLLPRATINETLKLWRANLGETALTPATTAHRVNQNMVAWLGICSSANPPALLPSQEPLWTLVGFPDRFGPHR